MLTWEDIRKKLVYDVRIDGIPTGKKGCMVLSSVMLLVDGEGLFKYYKHKQFCNWRDERDNKQLSEREVRRELLRMGIDDYTIAMAFRHCYTTLGK